MDLRLSLPGQLGVGIKRSQEQGGVKEKSRTAQAHARHKPVKHVVTKSMAGGLGQ